MPGMSCYTGEDVNTALLSGYSLTLVVIVAPVRQILILGA